MSHVLWMPRLKHLILSKSQCLSLMMMATTYTVCGVLDQIYSESKTAAITWCLSDVARPLQAQRSPGGLMV